MKLRNKKAIKIERISLSFRRGIVLAIAVIILAAGVIVVGIISGRDIRWAWPVKLVSEEEE